MIFIDIINQRILKDAKIGLMPPHPPSFIRKNL